MSTARDLSPSAVSIRLRWLLGAVVALMLTVMGRLVAIEVQDGEQYRASSAEPIVRTLTTPAVRGRILARDGTILAADEPIVALAVNYRWLEEPANARWLRQTARRRLTAKQRRNPQRIAAQQQAILAERHQLKQRLTALCGISATDWRRRIQRIQTSVESIAAGVNARHGILPSTPNPNSAESEESSGSMMGLVGRSIVDALFATDASPPIVPITIVEQISEHIVLEGLSLEAVAEIESRPQQYPGVKLMRTYRRAYPAGELAAQVLGYGRASSQNLGSKSDATALWVGQSGLERQCEDVLKSTPGMTLEQYDMRGHLKASLPQREASAGRDVITTLDPQLQQTAETLLDEILKRRLPSGNEQLDRSAGAAVVVMDIHRGDVLVAASAPRFDPNAFVRSDSVRIEGWLNDPAKPLFDRPIQMALPPGSVFKIVTAAAILDAGVNPHAPVDCRGYLHQPEALRCAIFRRLGIGHGPVTLADALARSCNVYFFHHAEQFGAAHLIDWGQRFGLGQRSGIDLAGEAAGTLPAANTNASGKTLGGDAPPIDPRPLSIGQGQITTTPLQMARVAAAIANGGRMISPHFVERPSTAASDRGDAQSSSIIPGLTADRLAVISAGLRQTVADEEGTAHATVDLAEVAIAGKTGTAQTGTDRPDHAWFVGFAPAENPRVAFAIAIEYAGDGALAAGPVAKHLMSQLHDRGYLSAKPHR